MNRASDKSVGVVILTQNSEKTIWACLAPVMASPLPERVLVVDSSSTDRTTAIAQNLGAEVKIIPAVKFNHGATREMARKELQTEIVIMMTDDAIIIKDDTFQHLVRPILDGAVAVAYARQVPRDGAGLFEAFPREYNYGAVPQIRGLEDADKYGVFTFFCSDSCAAYDNVILDEVGGFDTILTHEDYFVIAKMLKQGYMIAYVPEAIVQHSHKYSLKQEFQRYFEAGYVRAERPWIQELIGHADKRGFQLTAALMNRLIRQNVFLLPYAMVQALVKWAGYQAGIRGLNLPLRLKKTFSSQKHFWESHYYQPPQPPGRLQ